MEYDSTQYTGSAPHYVRGRPPYSSQLEDLLVCELGWDGTGTLADVGCGPGVLSLRFRDLFEKVVAIDPDQAMLAECRREIRAAEALNIQPVLSTAERLAELDLPPLRAVTFGYSFHRTDRAVVAELVYDMLEPGGAMVCIMHERGAPLPRTPEDPLVPDVEMQELITRYLGPIRRSGSGPVSRFSGERFEQTLERTRFGRPYYRYIPGRDDVRRDVEEVISRYLSMSYAAPHQFGAQLGSFVTDARALLAARTPSGFFWDWPGDTAVLIARKDGTGDSTL